MAKGTIKEVYIRRHCMECDPPDDVNYLLSTIEGCHNCGGAGYTEEWISIEQFTNEMKNIIEHGTGIL